MFKNHKTKKKQQLLTREQKSYMMNNMSTIRFQPVQEEIISEVERSFIVNAALFGGIRVDGRSLLEPRPIQLKLSTVANQSKSLAQCILGNTTKVYCTVSADLTCPYDDRPNEGMLTMQVDYMHSAGASPSTSSDMLFLERAILKAIDVESLCVVPGSKVWAVKCQLVVVDDCGAVMDACSIAACAALLHFRRPDVTVIGEEVTVHSIQDRIPVPLSIQYVPLIISYSLLDVRAILEDDEKRDIQSDWIALLDPTDREESVSRSGSFHIVLTAHKEICGVSEGGPFISRSAFGTLVDNAIIVRAERGLLLDTMVRSSPFLG